MNENEVFKVSKQKVGRSASNGMLLGSIGATITQAPGLFAGSTDLSSFASVTGITMLVCALVSGLGNYIAQSQSINHLKKAYSYRKSYTQENQTPDYEVKERGKSQSKFKYGRDKEQERREAIDVEYKELGR